MFSSLPITLAAFSILIMHSLSQFPVLDLTGSKSLRPLWTFVPSAVITVLSSQLFLTIILHFPAFMHSPTLLEILLTSSVVSFIASLTSQWGLCHLHSLGHTTCCHPPIPVLLGSLSVTFSPLSLSWSRTATVIKCTSVAHLWQPRTKYRQCQSQFLFTDASWRN